jgi:hypothetical protein
MLENTAIKESLYNIPMKKIQVFCDGCKRDITTTGNSIDYRLVLKSEIIPSGGGSVTDMLLYPIIEEDVHFCGLNCLKIWTNL